MRKIYVASSWRNPHQPLVVSSLRARGHEVYDFKDAEGFHWSEIDPNWQKWSPKTYIEGLDHIAAQRGFRRDMDALDWCDSCVYVMPCGPSASMELGYAVGRNKATVVYIPELREPDLMVKMADLVTNDINEVYSFLERS